MPRHFPYLAMPLPCDSSWKAREVKLTFFFLVPPGIYFSLQNEMYPNNSLVNLTDIGNVHTALICHTSVTTCCNQNDSIWRYPNRTEVQNRKAGGVFVRNRAPGIVRLFRNDESMVPIEMVPIGIYSCEIIIDFLTNATQLLQVGIYLTDEGNSSSCILQLFNVKLIP